MNQAKLRAVLPVSWITLRVFLLVAGIEVFQLFLVSRMIGGILRHFGLEIPEEIKFKLFSPWLKIGFLLFIAAMVAKEYLIEDEDSRFAINFLAILLLFVFQGLLIYDWLLPFSGMRSVSGG